MIKDTVYIIVKDVAQQEIKELSVNMLENGNKGLGFSEYDTQQLFYLQNIEYILDEIEQFDKDNSEVQSQPYNQEYTLTKDRAIDVVNSMLDTEYQNSWFADSITDNPEHDWYYDFVDMLVKSI